MAAPTFIGVGMQKSGTRWLYEQLRSHPDLWMPPVKEFHFFDAPFPSDRARQRVSKAEFRKDAADASFGDRLLALPTRRHSLETYRSLFEPAAGRITGEITPEYAGLPGRVVRQIADALPGLKVILMVRDPVERAWSALNDAVNAGKLPVGAVHDPALLRQALAKPSMAQVSFPSRAYAKWSAAFECRAFFLEEVAARPEAVRDAILTYLGASSERQGPIPANHNSKAGRPRAPQTPEVRAALVDAFADEIRQCAQLFKGAAAEWPGRHGLRAITRPRVWGLVGQTFGRLAAKAR